MVDSTPPSGSRRAQRAVVRAFAADWQRRTVRALRGDGATEAHIAIVAGFAGSGCVPGTAAAEAFALCLEVAQLTTRVEAARCSTILIEPDPVLAERLAGFLREAGTTVRLGDGSTPPEPGEVTVLNAAFTDAVPVLGRSIADAARSLLLLDPPAPGDLPLAALQPLLATSHSDFLITLPTAELHLHARFDSVPLADLPPRVRRSADGYAALCGDARYEWLLRWRAAVAAGGDAERAVAEHYRARLAAADGGTIAKHAALRPEGAPSGALHLLLATHEPAGALDLNRVVRTTRQAGHIAWGDADSPYVHEHDPGVLDLFGAAAGAPPARTRRVDHAALAADLASRHAGEHLAFADVLAGLVHTELFVEDVRRALSLLKRERRARYGVLTGEAEIVFAVAGETFARRAGRSDARSEKAIDLPGLEGPAGR